MRLVGISRKNTVKSVHLPKISLFCGANWLGYITFLALYSVRQEISISACFLEALFSCIRISWEIMQ